MPYDLIKKLEADSAIITDSATVRQAAECISRNSLKIAIVADRSKKLLGTISDGDIRRALLEGKTLDCSVMEVMSSYPVAIKFGCTFASVRKLMASNNIQQLPEVDEYGRLTALYVRSDEVSERISNTRVVIMAGGLGSRLRPLTDKCPKPMLQVHDKPILEHIIDSAKGFGFTKFYLCINYLGNIIEEYFKDGTAFNVEIKYLKESSPMGTCGPLSLFDHPPQHPFIVLNGDVLTETRLDDILEFHIEHGADVTVAVRTHELQNPFGVVTLDGSRICGFEEKPIYKSYINAGVYVFNPAVLEILQHGKFLQMSDFLQLLIEQRYIVSAYPIFESWVDIGRPSDLARVRA